MSIQHEIFLSLTIALANISPAFSQTPHQYLQPTETQLKCTRGTNPYQDLKDSLPLITDDFRKAGIAVKQKNSSTQKKIAKSINQKWQTFVKNAGLKNRAIPQELTADVERQIMVLKEPFKSDKPITTESLQKTQDAIDAFAQTLTCDEPSSKG